jgi:ankyrin repeat protein
VDVPEAKFSSLTTAFLYNAIESARLLIAAGADVNGSGYKTTPLAAATLYDNITAAKLLLDANADVKSARGFESSLLLAARYGC